MLDAAISTVCLCMMDMPRCSAPCALPPHPAAHKIHLHATKLLRIHPATAANIKQSHLTQSLGPAGQPQPSN